MGSGILSTTRFTTGELKLPTQAKQVPTPPFGNLPR
jgi:hypothetical protein